MITYRIVRDEDAQKPSEFGDRNLFLATTNNRYFSETPDGKTLDEWTKELRDSHWHEPLYMYAHGGVALSTKPFACLWDSGRVGTVFVSREEWPLSHDVGKAAEGLVETWNQYLSGDVWGYTIVESDPDGEFLAGYQLDSCWGFYGKAYAEAEAKAALAAIVEARAEEEVKTARMMAI